MERRSKALNDVKTYDRLEDIPRYTFGSQPRLVKRLQRRSKSAAVEQNATKQSTPNRKDEENVGFTREESMLCGMAGLDDPMAADITECRKELQNYFGIFVKIYFKIN